MLDWRLPDNLERIAKADIPLALHTSFRIGGAAKRLLVVDTPIALVEAVSVAKQRDIPWRLLGGGTNVLAADEGFDGLAILYRSGLSEVEISHGALAAGAGVNLHKFVLASVDAGFSGLEFCAGIPGTLGGAIYGNAGAFGEAIGERLESVELFDPNTGETRQAHRDELTLSYRSSRMKTSGEIILRARFSLADADKEKSMARIKEILAFRKAKHPDRLKEPSAGSFFKNLEPTSKADRRKAAGALLEDVGAKKMKEGGAQVFSKHANMIINTGEATAKDVRALAYGMQKAVWEKFGIILQREVEAWPINEIKELDTKKVSSEKNEN